ncbi:TIGR03364 family FAD-dependent oxidoreductase [Rhizobacter sp. OV335]|uniref:TIGR03364 family FAD-dependent oxidoreductase n=1 Tax=Rhizobacter sp. OV335 TaxID=1500264 RepID=UPI000921F3FB|nr:TIGR03364 family FAD-dependent oxidoreductase [Rhizobacter sp. OV335]SHN20716.1 FAD dependent oxidoreductase TIGR03364 [Rhizobacter sp. OV335]
MTAKRLAIVGAGVVGLMHAWAAARQGWQVRVFECDAWAVGASVRNFGLGLVVGQPAGEMLDLARRSRALWLELLPAIGTWHRAEGSLTVARNAEEWALLQSFHALKGGEYGTQLRTAAQLADHQLNGIGALSSPQEIAFEAREAIPALALWLSERHGVEFHYRTQVHAITLPRIETSRGRFDADRAIVCSGSDFLTLYPDAFAPLVLQRCALQMLRLANPGPRYGSALLTGLSCLHYPSFTGIPGIDALRSRVQRDTPELIEHGIHLIVQQLGEAGELVVGDSHHYSGTVEPFHDERIDELLLALAGDLLGRPLRVLQRWQGVYASGPRPFEVLNPAPRVQAVAITAGVGMSIAPALAERVIAA